MGIRSFLPDPALRRPSAISSLKDGGQEHSGIHSGSNESAGRQTVGGVGSLHLVGRLFTSVRIGQATARPRSALPLPLAVGPTCSFCGIVTARRGPRSRLTVHRTVRSRLTARSCRYRLGGSKPWLGFSRAVRCPRRSSPAQFLGRLSGRSHFSVTLIACILPNANRSNLYPY
jgi:hypothetical protein